MTDNLKNALNTLKNGGYTCVISNARESFELKERGVLPLIKLYDSGKDFSSFSAADKVIGKAAAMIYVLLGIKEVYAPIISDAAAEVFALNGITFYFDQKVPRILNRTNTGFCPMEEAVLHIDDIEEALEAMRRKTETMRSQTFNA